MLLSRRYSLLTANTQNICKLQLPQLHPSTHQLKTKKMMNNPSSHCPNPVEILSKGNRNHICFKFSKNDRFSSPTSHRWEKDEEDGERTKNFVETEEQEIYYSCDKLFVSLLWQQKFPGKFGIQVQNSIFDPSHAHMNSLKIIPIHSAPKEKKQIQKQGTQRKLQCKETPWIMDIKNRRW